MNKKPDSVNHNPDPAYLRGLLDKASITQREAARIIGVSERMMHYYLSPENEKTHRHAPYLVQYTLEQLANKDH